MSEQRKEAEPMDAQQHVEIAETLDRLMTLDIPARGIIRQLYQAAREKSGQPLTLAAAQRLQQAVQPGDVVMIATGWVDQPLVAPGCGETDGPPGAVVLARALRVACRARPIILVDECLVEGVKQIARSAGFQCVPPEHLMYSIERNKLLTLSVLPFPSSPDAARAAAQELLRDWQPAACVAIERGGMNKAGCIHNMAGFDTGDTQAKLDLLFVAARDAGIATLAIGDGGNEIGMANIADAVRAHVPYAERCQCPCGQGLVPATEVDVLVAATISNWGAYAIAALLGALYGEAEAIHTPEREAVLLTGAAAAGFHDPLYGSVAPSADGCTLEVQAAMVALLRETVLQRLK